MPFRLWRSLFLGLPAVALFLSSYPVEAEPMFMGLGNLPGGGSPSVAHSVSADGSTVVGESDGASGVPIAFRWTAEEGMMALGVLPGGFTSAAYDVSADGSAVVGRSNTQGANTPTSGDEAFRWTAEDGLQGLGDLPGGAFISHANGTSVDGSIVVGYSRVGARTRIMDSFRWADETGMLGLGGFPGITHNNFANATSADGSIVVGYGQSLNGIEAYRWTADTGIVGLGVLPGAAWFQSFAEGISSDGSVIVGRSNSALGGEAYRWTAEGGMESLGTLPESNLSWAMATSSDGSVVVGFGNVDGFRVAFVWDPTSGMRSLRQILTDEGIDLTGWRLLEATDVSDDGRTVVGYGIDPAGGTQAWLAELPGPDVLEVEIDIKPGSDTNPIELAHSTVIPVAILSSDAFDALNVDSASVCFGSDPPNRSRSDCTESHERDHSDEDVDGDGYLDLVLHFDNYQTGISLGDTEACLTGTTLDGTAFGGCDAIRVIFSCGIGFELAFLLPPLMWLRGRRRRPIH